MVLLEEGSGSNRHNVDNVKLGSDGKLYISIRSYIPLPEQDLSAVQRSGFTVVEWGGTEIQ